MPATAPQRSEPVRVLIVDDSAFMRTAVSRLLASDSRFVVVGAARDGAEAVRLVHELRPDVVTMDFNMPGLNGAQATRQILRERPTAVVMLSAHTRDGARETAEALSAGALDVVAKPDGEVSASLALVRDELVQKLLAAAGSNVATIAEPAEAPPNSFAPARRIAGPRPIPAGSRLVVIASSTGGPAALSRVLPGLSLQNRATLLVVQHMPSGFTGPLAQQLAAQAGYPIREAIADEELRPGLALIAPGGLHLSIDRGRVVLRQDPPVHGVRPAADVTLTSAAKAFGARCIGVVLTGMGRDGAMGLAAIKAAGGRTIAQDAASSTVYGMPKAATELGVVDEVAPLHRIASLIGQHLK